MVGSKTMWMIFCESTSIKGVSRAVKASTPFLKISWAVCVLFGASMTCYLMYRIISQYLQYQTATLVKEITAMSAPFPYITICKVNPSPINFKDQNKSVVINQFLQRLQQIEWKLLNMTENVESQTQRKYDENDITTQSGPNILGIDNTKNIFPPIFHNEYEYDYKWDDFIYMENNVKKDDRLTDKEQIFTFIAPLQGLGGYLQNADLNDTYSESVSEFVTECIYTTWNGKHINCGFERNSYKFYSTDYPACFTFYPKRETQFSKSMSMIIYLNDFFDVALFDKNFTVFSTATTGVKVFVHPIGTLPDFDDGVEVGPGVKSNIILQGQKWSREPAPYTNCKPLEDQKEFLSSYGYLYTENVCVTRCKQLLMLTKCQCVHPNIISTAHDRSQAPFCGRIIDNDTDIDIIQKRIECFMGVKDQTELCSQECPPPCDEYKYTYIKSDAAWPHKSYLSSFITKINNAAGLYTTLIKDYGNKKKENDQGDSGNEVDFDIIEAPPNIGISEDPSLILVHSPTNNNDEAIKLKVDTDQDINVLKDIIKDNFLLVNVQMHGKRVIEYRDKAVVSLDGLLGSIGGTLNLWIGITFVTLIELCEMCYHIGSRAIIGTTRNIIKVTPLNKHETDISAVKRSISIVNGNRSLVPNI